MFSAHKFTVQSFSGSLRMNDENESYLPASNRRCCSPCKSQDVVTVRPVLCSRQLDQSTNGVNYESHSIGNQLRTRTSAAYVERTNEQSRMNMDNWDRAKYYNEHVDQLRQEKAQKLLEFQRDVRIRVKRMEEHKQEAMLAKTYREAELERKVARKTAFLAQASLPNASDVMVHGRNDLIVKSNELIRSKTDSDSHDSMSDTLSTFSGSVSLPSLPSTITTCSDGVSSRYSGSQLQEVEDISQSVDHEKRMKQRARHKLMSRKLLTQTTESELPGGFWRDTATLEFPAPADEEYTETGTEGDQGADELAAIAEEISLEDLQTNEENKPRVKSHMTKASRRPLYYISSQEEEEVRKQEVKQRALLRRLYMDMEREQVKEYKKLKSHIDRIAQIKKVKEEERSRQELQSELDLFPPPCPSPSLSDTARDLLNKERQLRKEKETKRYVKALRSLLREKVERLRVDVPPLCSCGENIWDTHPDLCANNCPFYKNPKGYERAVQALLTSCDIND